MNFEKDIIKMNLYDVRNKLETVKDIATSIRDDAEKYCKIFGYTDNYSIDKILMDKFGVSYQHYDTLRNKVYSFKHNINNLIDNIDGDLRAVNDKIKNGTTCEGGDCCKCPMPDGDSEPEAEEADTPADPIMPEDEPREVADPPSFDDPHPDEVVVNDEPDIQSEEDRMVIEASEQVNQPQGG